MLQEMRALELIRGNSLLFNCPLIQGLVTAVESRIEHSQVYGPLNSCGSTCFVLYFVWAEHQQTTLMYYP
jgi:hypothetical protein